MCPDHRFRDRPTPRDVDDQACNERAQVEASVEAVGEGGQVVFGVLAVLQRMECTGQGRLQVAEYRVDQSTELKPQPL